jgi:predicted amidohydrolase YtcJ
LIGIQRGVTRSGSGSENDASMWPEERVNLEEMIASFTVHAAFANFLEHEIGSLEVGKSADLVVLDKSLFDIPEIHISNTKVLLTLVGGEKLYQAPGFE